MLAELDILAIEPFYGGQRKAMLETLIRGSGHRWTLLKLPPRRIERRLVSAAQWFSEHLNLHWVANVDLIFASDALNLADLYRLIPTFAGKPSVVYFHDNQLPVVGSALDFPAADESEQGGQPVQTAQPVGPTPVPVQPEAPPIIPAARPVLANLSSAATAQELWFNSACHMQTFLDRTRYLLEQQNKDFSRNPLSELAEKSKVMPPPTDLHLAQHVQTASSVQRDKRTLFIDTRDADCRMLNQALATLATRNEKFQLITVGPAIGLSDQWKRAIVPENNDFAIVQGMLKSGIYISARSDLYWDGRLLTALSAGCWPIVPTFGVYPELIPKELEERCLYDGTPGHLAFTIQDFWELQLPEGHREAIESIMRPHQAEDVIAAMDQRMVELAIAAPSTG